MGHTPGPYVIGEPGGVAGPFYSIISSQGRVVAMQILNRDDAVLWKAAPLLLAALESVEWVDGQEPAEGMGGMMEQVCPWCGGLNPRHEPDCIRQAAIAAARGTTEEMT